MYDDNKPQFNPIFYERSSRLVLVRSGTFWLSMSPTKRGSKLPKAADPRICTWAEMKVLSRSRRHHLRFYVANTHLNWKNVNVAKKQIEICTHYLKNTVMDRRRYPIVLMGDLNWEDNTSVYKALENTDWLSNTMAESIKTYPALTAITLDGSNEKELIDYIWQNNFESLLSATTMNARPNGRMISDHRPVLAAVQFT